jgi:6-phosphogluconate dehydrogenase
MDAQQPPLIGSSRIRLVDGLLALVDEVQQTGTTRWVSLEAPSGWGKTRVAQALFERLAARQSQRYYLVAKLRFATQATKLCFATPRCRRP